MKRPLALIAVFALCHAAHAQDGNAVRGGWVTEADGETQIFMLMVRGTAVTGVACVDCTDPKNLAFIRDGHLDSDGVSFTIRRETPAGGVSLEDVRGVMKGRELVLRVHPHTDSAPLTTVRLHRPAPMAALPAVTNDEAEAGAAIGQRPRYVLPGPPEPISADKLLGLWLWGTGPGKQYFIIRHAGSELLGMVCGPCDNPNRMAPLDGFVINGTDLRFNIVHEDTGAAVEHGPFNNVAHATLARNELHIKVVPSYQPDSRPIEMTLLGPVVFERPGH